MITEIEQINQLRDELNEANKAYYVNSNPTLSDFDFDMKMKELQRLEALHPELDNSNSPTKKVGSDLSTGFKQAYHKYPMLSLANTYNEAEIRDFDKRVRSYLPNESIVYDCELKFDGISISLTYEHGHFVKAVTRGDGVKGDDVTNNVRMIKSIPLTLNSGNFPDFFEIRGEVLMPHMSFEKINKDRELKGLPPMANCRNATSGTIKSLDPAVTATRNLDCYLYFLLMDNLPTNSHYENLNLAKSWGFNILTENNGSIQTDSIEGIIDFINYWNTERHNLPFDIDGIVIKVDSMDQRNRLGLTSKVPRWAIAFKYKAEEVLTKIERIDFQVGRYGVITPVANMTPVHLAGTIVKRASLYNEDELNRLDLYYEDYVYVEKSAEIIPKITKVEINRRLPIAQKVIFPSVCPECGNQLVKKGNIWYCPNKQTCNPQLIGRLIHFTSREAMDIKIGEATINKLVKVGLLKDVSDFYRLTINDLLTIDGFAQKSAENLINSIEKSKSVPFERVLYSLSIRYVGARAAKLFVKKFKSLTNLVNASLENLKNINDIGEIIANSLYNSLKDPNLLSLINKLPLKWEEDSSSQANTKINSTKLINKNFVVTGTFDTPEERVVIEELVVCNGGKLQGSPNSKTTYVISGSKPGATKIEKAKKLGIDIISKEDFIKLL